MFHHGHIKCASANLSCDSYTDTYTHVCKIKLKRSTWTSERARRLALPVLGIGHAVDIVHVHT